MSSVCVTRGRPTWVVGLKRTLFESAAPEWQAARDKGHRSAGVFYDNFTKRFIATFGWNFDIWTDKDCPIATEEQWQCIDDHTGLDVAEISKRQKYAKWLRTKVIAWFCSHYGRISSTDTPEDISEMFNGLVDAPKAPRRRRMYQYYSHEYFQQRIGTAKLNQLWEAEKQKIVPDGTKRLTRLELTNLVTQEAWNRETPEFREWLTKQRDKEHKIELEKHKLKLKEIEEAPDSPESYHKALANAGAFLQPLADIAAQKFGAAVSILLALPIGSKGGKVELRSIHSGATNTLNPQTWPEFDREGFNGVQSSFVNFGNHVFTEVQRVERVLADDITLFDDANDDELLGSGTSGASANDPLLTTTSDATHPITSFDLSFLDSLAPFSIPDGDGASFAKNTEPPLPSGTTTLTTMETPLPGTTHLAATQPNGVPPAITPPPQDAEMPLSFPIPPPNRQVSPTVAPSMPEMLIPLHAPRPPSRQPTTVTEAVHLDDVPQSARTAFAAVLDTGNEWGSAWAGCVTSFVALERLHSFDLKEYRLPASLRPIEFKQWITAKRASDWVPSVGAATFGASWLAWWADIQPPGRVEEGKSTLSTAADGLLWQKLAKTGPSGVFLVLVGLAWWRRLIGVECVEWTDAVLDVEWALQQVLASAPPKLVKKRKGTVVADDTPPAKKRVLVPSRRALGLL